MKIFRQGNPMGKLVVVLVPLVALFVFVAVRTGPFASVPVTVATVESRGITPTLSGIGTVQARFTQRIGPTSAGRVKWLGVDVGETTRAGQTLGEMDPVDIEERVHAQRAAIKSAEAGLRQAEERESFARTQLERYEKLRAAQSASEELVATRRQEWKVAAAALDTARADVSRLSAELNALNAQQENLRLVSPVDGLVTERAVEPGTTVVAGQTVLELIDPSSLWVEARFDQISSEGLAPGLACQVVLRSRPDQSLPGRILRVEPKADVVTEEMLAKIIFDVQPEPLPAVGELAEVSARLAALPVASTIPNAALHSYQGRRGVWKLDAERAVFTPVSPGRADLDGHVQIVSGLAVGDRVIVYSEKPLKPRRRVRVVESLTTP